MQQKQITMDEYFSMLPKDVQTILQEIRRRVRRLAPEAEETISYGVPTFNLNGTYLVYFGAWKHHIGFYPTPSGTEAFKKELALYKGGKGSVRFPLDKPMPYELIEKIVAFRVKESAGKP